VPKFRLVLNQYYQPKTFALKKGRAPAVANTHQLTNTDKILLSSKIALRRAHLGVALHHDVIDVRLQRHADVLALHRRKANSNELHRA